MSNESIGCLVVLSADKNMEFAVKGILSRDKSLKIQNIIPEYYIHPNHDPGCLNKGHLFLKPFINQYKHAIILFDREGCGKESKSREELEEQVENNLSSNGWGDRAAAIVIDPELEIWIWSDSPHVDSVLGWHGKKPQLREILKAKGYFKNKNAKPFNPKEAMELSLKKVNKPRSSSIYKQIAEKVSLEKCTDRSFRKLKRTLQRWFPAV